MKYETYTSMHTTSTTVLKCERCDSVYNTKYFSEKELSDIAKRHEENHALFDNADVGTTVEGRMPLEQGYSCEYIGKIVQKDSNKLNILVESENGERNWHPIRSIRKDDNWRFS